MNLVFLIFSIGLFISINRFFEKDNKVILNLILSIIYPMTFFLDKFFPYHFLHAIPSGVISFSFIWIITGIYLAVKKDQIENLDTYLRFVLKFSIITIPNTKIQIALLLYLLIDNLIQRRKEARFFAIDILTLVLIPIYPYLLDLTISWLVLALLTLAYVLTYITPKNEKCFVAIFVYWYLLSENMGINYLVITTVGISLALLRIDLFLLSNDREKLITNINSKELIKRIHLSLKFKVQYSTILVSERMPKITNRQKIKKKYLFIAGEDTTNFVYFFLISVIIIGEYII